MSNPFLKFHAICNIAVGIASTTMSEEQGIGAGSGTCNRGAESRSQQARYFVLWTRCALIGRAAFPTPENRAEFEREVMPVLALKTLLESIEGESGSFEA